jgi:hypothetical protein
VTNNEGQAAGHEEEEEEEGGGQHGGDDATKDKEIGLEVSGDGGNEILPVDHLEGAASLSYKAF